MTADKRANISFGVGGFLFFLGAVLDDTVVSQIGIMVIIFGIGVVVGAISEKGE